MGGFEPPEPPFGYGLALTSLSSKVDREYIHRESIRIVPKIDCKIVFTVKK